MVAKLIDGVPVSGSGNSLVGLNVMIFCCGWIDMAEKGRGYANILWRHVNSPGCSYVPEQVRIYRCAEGGFCRGNDTAIDAPVLHGATTDADPEGVNKGVHEQNWAPDLKPSVYIGCKFRG
ncbi:hypothetical protein OAA86_10995 [Rhodospirillales bacterium]|nr:hypothetical protein [Rhodospirillales bacterium]